MKIFPLASSSTGNATLIETKKAKILVDCGITLKLLKQVLGNDNLPGAVFITHEHGDHIRGAGPVGRSLKIPLYMHQYSYNVKKDTLNKCDIKFLKPSEKITFKDLEIIPFSTKHDCMYSFGFVIHEQPNGPKLCYLGDTGMITKLMMEKIKDCNTFFIEADYDVKMLEKYADYSDELKERISSNVGHLSNDQVIALIKTLDLDKMKLITLGHLSSKTNSPEKIQKLLDENFPNHLNKFKLAPFTKSVEIL